MLKAPNSSKQLNQYSFLSDNTYDYLRDLESFLSKLVFQITLTENEKSNELIQKALQSFEQQLTNTKTNQEIEKIKSKLFDNDPVLHFFELHDEIIGITLSKQQRKELQAAFYSLYFRFLILREPIESIESQIKKRNEFLNRLTDEYSTFLDANELADDPYELTYLYRFETVLFLLKNEKKINRHELKLPLMIASMIDGSPDGKRYIIGGRSAKDSERRQKLITYILDLKNKHSKISVNEMKKGATLLATLKSDHQNPTDSSNVDVLDKPSLLSAESTGISSGDHTILKQHKAEESMMVVEHIEPFNQADVKDNRNDEIKQKSIMNPSSFTPDIFLLEDDYTYLENTDLFVIKTKFLLKDQGQDVRDILGKQIKEFITELNEGKAGIDNIQRKWSEPTLDLIRTNTSQKKQLSFNERNEIYAAFVSAFLRFNFLASQRNFKENDTLTQHTNQERERFFNKVQKEYTAIWDSCDLSSYELTYLYRFERAISSLKNILSANRNKGLFLTIGTLLEGSPAATKYTTGGNSSVETKRRVSLIECLCQTKKRIKRRNLNYKSAAIEFIEEQSEPSLLEKRKATEESKDQPPSVRVAISNDSFSLDSSNVDVLDKPSLLSAESTGISSGDHTILKQHKAEESMMVVEHIEPFNQADVKDNRNDEIKQKSIMNPSSFTPDIFLLEDDYTYLENTDLFVIKTKFLLKDQGQDVRDILGKQIKEFITELNEGKAGIDNIQRKWSEPTLDLIRTNTSQKKQLSFNERNEIYAAFVSAFLRFNFLASQRNFKENDTLTQHTNQERERFFNKVQKEYTAIWDSCDLSSYELTYLYRFERAISSLKNILSANRNKGLFLTIGTLLEGSPAATKYTTGGNSSVETKRRVSLIECLCQTKKRIKRRNLNYKSAAIEFIEEQSEPSLLEKRKATEESKDQPPSVRVAISNDSFSLDSAPNLPSVIDLCKVVDEPTLQLTNPRVSNQKNSYSNHCSYTTSILSDEKQNERYIQIWTNGLLKDYWAVCEFYQAKNDGSANNHAIEELHQKISQHEDIDLLTNDDICSSPTHYQKFCEQYIKKCKEERSKLREKHSGYTFFYQTGQLTKKIQQIEDIICKLNPVLHEPTIDNPAEFSQNSFKEDDEFNTILKEDDEFNTILKEDDEFNTILNELIADENGITPYSYATPLLNNSVFNKKPAHQASSSPQHKSQRKNPYDDGLIDLINEVIADDGESNAYS